MGLEERRIYHGQKNDSHLRLWLWQRSGARRLPVKPCRDEYVIQRIAHLGRSDICRSRSLEQVARLGLADRQKTKGRDQKSS